MQKLDKIQQVKVAEQSVEVDPRSKTTADGAFNLIADYHITFIPLFSLLSVVLVGWVHF